MSNNVDAAQILPDGLSGSERREIEAMAAKVKEGKTNYFQVLAIPLTAPKEVMVNQKPDNDARNITVGWSTAFAADAPLKSYEIIRDGEKTGEKEFTVQITTDLHTWTEVLTDRKEHTYVVKVTDEMGREASSVPAVLSKA